jgi:hypothetical protein
MAMKDLYLVSRRMAGVEVGYEVVVPLLLVACCLWDVMLSWDRTRLDIFDA